MSFSMDMSGLIERLRQGSEQMKREAVRAVDQFGEHVLGDAQHRCPVDTEFLQGSGTTDPAEAGADGNVTKRIGFNASYAAAVHERLDVHHEIGEAKFLENAIKANAPKLAGFVAGRLKGAGF